ncbi:MAG: hypothetical protein V8T10_06280 [Merdibacter sp.]
MNTWEEVYSLARQKCGICRCCPSCNGRACRGETPGPGGKGTGSAFVRNVDMLEKVMIVMDTITGNEEVDTSSDFFGTPLSLPVYAATISGIRQRLRRSHERNGLYGGGRFRLWSHEDDHVYRRWKDRRRVQGTDGGARRAWRTWRADDQAVGDGTHGLARRSGERRTSCPAMASDIDATG